MAELADALDSGSNGRKVVQVQVLLPAPSCMALIDRPKKIGVFRRFSSFFTVFLAFSNFGKNGEFRGFNTIE